MSDITPLNPEPTYSRREEHLSYVELSKLCKELEGAVSRAALAHARDFTAWKRERRELVARIAELEQMVIDTKSNV